MQKRNKILIIGIWTNIPKVNKVLIILKKDSKHLRKNIINLFNNKNPNCFKVKKLSSNPNKATIKKKLRIFKNKNKLILLKELFKI